jgi:WD40 repeat protein
VGLLPLACSWTFLILAVLTLEQPKQFKHEKPAEAIAFSRDGKTLAVCSGNEVYLWDVNSGQETKRLVRFADQPKPTVQQRAFFEGPPKYPPQVAFSTDGKSVEATWDFDFGWRLTHRWNVATGEELSVSTMDSKGPGWFPAMHSPDGKVQATADVDRSRGSIAGRPPPPGKDVLLVEATSGKELWKLQGHSGNIQALTFSSDGKILASGASDKVVRLWKVDTGKQLRILEGHQGPIRALAFSPGGALLASGSDDGTARLWVVNFGKK